MTSRPSNRQSPGGGGTNWIDRIDWVTAVRGASRGFGILAISGLLQPVVANGLGEAFGLGWLVLGSLVAFVSAAWRAGESDSPPLTGLFGSLMAYTLSVPLIYLATRKIVVQDVLMFVAAAMVVGAVTGYLVGRRHTNETDR